jgi:superfamily II DNA or RNA helicase
MFFILNSGHSSTLMQLATGTGKSLMFGLMARFINAELKYKVAVIVPNETLATI